MDEEKQVFNELENLILKFKRLRFRTSIGLKEKYFDVVIILLEQAKAYYAHFILGDDVKGVDDNPPLEDENK